MIVVTTRSMMRAPMTCKNKQVTMMTVRQRQSPVKSNKNYDKPCRDYRFLKQSREYLIFSPNQRPLYSESQHIKKRPPKRCILRAPVLKRVARPVTRSTMHSIDVSKETGRALHYLLPFSTSPRFAPVLHPESTFDTTVVASGGLSRLYSKTLKNYCWPQW